MLPLRKELQIIFQDPYASLDPRMTVLDIIGEPLLYQKDPDLKEKVKEIMQLVGLEVKHMNRYPHAFSGGQRQRIGIARALVTNPRFIVADEAVSALDVSIQAQVINLLKSLQKKLGLTILFISHDLTVVQHICSKVAVMYVGRIVEVAETKELFLFSPASLHRGSHVIGSLHGPEQEDGEDCSAGRCGQSGKSPVGMLLSPPLRPLPGHL